MVFVNQANTTKMRLSETSCRDKACLVRAKALRARAFYLKMRLSETSCRDKACLVRTKALRSRAFYLIMSCVK